MNIAILGLNTSFTDNVDALILKYFKGNRLGVPEITQFHDPNTLLSVSTLFDILIVSDEISKDTIADLKNEYKCKGVRLIIIETSVKNFLSDFQKKLVQSYSCNHKIPIETRDGIFTVSSSTIICIETNGHNVIVHTISKDYFSLLPLKDILAKLPVGIFYQAHRSNMINFKFIDSFNHEAISLNNSKYKEYLTRRKYKDFKSKYMLYLHVTKG